MPVTNVKSIYDIIIVGRGTAAASYLRSLRAEHLSLDKAATLPTDILVIGKPDPWAGARGYSTNTYAKNINQAAQLVDHGTDAMGKRGQDPVDRLAFAVENEKILKEATGNNIVDGEVIMIGEAVKDQQTVYKVETMKLGSFFARKIVLATGAGIEESERNYHRLPTYISARIPGVIMNLDEFMSSPSLGRTGNKTIAIIGPTAGTDALMETSTRRFPIQNVYWLMKKADQEGTALTWPAPGSFPASEAIKLKSAGGTIVECNTRALTVTQSSGKVVVSESGVQKCSVDMLVYALGQGGGGFMRAPNAGADKGKLVAFVDPALTAKLEPVYDKDQRYGSHAVGEQGEFLHTGGAWQHVLGLQLEGTTKLRGFEIIGSGAQKAAGKVDHNYLDQEYFRLYTACYDVIKDLARSKRLTMFEVLKFKYLVAAAKAGKINFEVYRYERNSLVRHGTDYYRRKAKSQYSYFVDYAAASAGKRLVTDLCDTMMLRIAAASEYGSLNNSSVGGMMDAGLSRSLPAQVGSAALIGGVQRNVEVFTGSLRVDRVTTKGALNFLEDQTTIAISIATHYPGISEGAANGFVTRLLRARKDEPRGFSQQQIALFYRELDGLNTP